MTDLSTPKPLPRGAAMIDVVGTMLSDDDRRRLLNPNVGGVILFRRNFLSIEQLKELVREIKALRTPELLIAVDHEGGRVQRFINGFTRLPAMANLGKYADKNGIHAAEIMAEKTGFVLAAELRACSIDLSFTPVLDLDYACCAVIGNRSFHRNPDMVARLAIALQKGLKNGGMSSCGKHFPGHGSVAEDSHLELPRDPRELSEMADDLLPFQKLIAQGMQSIMPAHVLYHNIDAQPAGFSAYWLQNKLRQEMGFDGIIFSDDLTMEGATGAGDIYQRTLAALNAGCDVVLVCNSPEMADELIANRLPENPDLQRRWNLIAGRGDVATFNALLQTPEFIQTAQEVAVLCELTDTAAAPQVGEEF